MDRVETIFTCECCGVRQVVPELVQYNGLVEKIEVQRMALRNYQVAIDRRNKTIADMKSEIYAWQEMQRLKEDVEHERSRRNRLAQRVAERLMVCCVREANSVWTQGDLECSRRVV